MVQKFKQFGLILGLLAVVAMGGYGDVARANSEPTAKTEVKAGAKETAKETATEAASHSGEDVHNVFVHARSG